jgi:nitrite reductase (NADH) small subunit
MQWHFAARADEFIEGEPKIVQIENKEIGVIYKQGQYFAVLNHCPHAKAEICRGRVSGTLFSPSPNEYDMQHDFLVLRCPWHHWEFSLETGKAVIPSTKQRLKLFSVKAEADGVYVEV